jgi:hypothetical protein
MHMYTHTAYFQGSIAMHACTYMCMYICMYVTLLLQHIYMFLLLCMYIYVCMCRHTFLLAAYLHAFLLLCMYIYMCIYLYTHVFAAAYLHGPVAVHVWTYIHVYVHMYVCHLVTAAYFHGLARHVCMYLLLCMDGRTNVRIIYVNVCTYMNVYACVRVYVAFCYSSGAITYMCVYIRIYTPCYSSGAITYMCVYIRTYTPCYCSIFPWSYCHRCFAFHCMYVCMCMCMCVCAYVSCQLSGL